MRTALVIDDHLWMRRLTREFLEERGYDVVEAADCSTGLEILDETRVDIVITDIIMASGMEGMEFIATLRAQCPDLPIVAVSAGGRGGDCHGYLDTALALGASAVVAKPFEPEELLEPVDRLLFS